MEKVAMAFGMIGFSIGSLFFFIVLSTLMGGIAGWVVGAVFGDTILGIAGQLGIHGVTMYQLGIFLGFIGGFMRTKTEVKEK